MKPKRILPSLIVGLILTLHASVPTVHAQAPLFFDAFLFDNGGMPANDFNAFFQWSVTNGSVDLAGGNIPGMDDPALGGRFVDLAGSSGDPGVFATLASFPFLAGVTYNLSFLYSNTGGAMNQATAMIGSQVFNITATGSSFVSFSQNFTFPGATMANLRFEDLGLGGDNFGVGIDRVQISQVVPEPASVILLALGGALLVHRQMRCSQKGVQPQQLA